MKRHHFAVLCAALGGFMDLYCTQAIFPELQQRFDTGPAGAGALVTATTLGIAIASPFVGGVVQRIGARAAMLFGLALLALLSLSICAISDWTTLLGIRLLQGLTIPLVLSSVLASIHEHWDGKRALAISATYVTGTILGGVLGRYLPAAIITWADWRLAFMTLAALHLLLLGGAALFFPANQKSAAHAASVSLPALVALWRERLQGLSFAGFCLLFSQNAVFTYITIRLSGDPFNFSSALLGALYLVFLPSLAFVRFTPGFVGRHGGDTVLKGAVVVSWLGLGLTLTDQLGSIALGLTIFSTAVFISQTVLTHRVGQSAPQAKAAASGVYLFSYYLGGGLGALLPALVWPSFGWIGCLTMILAVQAGGFVFFNGARLAGLRHPTPARRRSGVAPVLAIASSTALSAAGVAVVDADATPRWRDEIKTIIGAVKAFHPSVADYANIKPIERLALLRQELHRVAPQLTEFAARLNDKLGSAGSGVFVPRLGLGALDVNTRSLLAYALGACIGEPTPTDQVRRQVIWDVKSRKTDSQFQTFSEHDREASFHTDTQYFSMPERHFLLYVMEPAHCGGGRSHMCDGRALRRALESGKTRWIADQLTARALPFRVPSAFATSVDHIEATLAPIFSDGPFIRYRRDTLIDGLQHFPEYGDAELKRALDAFDRHVTSFSGATEFMMPRDSLMFTDNHHALHARTAFTDQSRHLLRIRLRAEQDRAHENKYPLATIRALARAA